MSVMMNTCNNCRFFHMEPRSLREGHDYGECRMKPPTVVANATTSITQWPRVWVKDWCGEFKPASADGEATQ